MNEAEVILQQIRDAGFRLHAITGNGHWFLFAYRGDDEFSVRGEDYLRVVKALALAVGVHRESDATPSSSPTDDARG